MTQAATSRELYYQVALGMIPGIGDVLAKNMVSYCGGVAEVFRQKKQKLLRIPGIGEKLAEAILQFNDFARVEEELAFIEKHHIRPLFYTDPDYPWRLRQFDDAPAMLYYLGNANLNHDKIVGIVGTRKFTDYGKAFVEKLVEELKPSGALILSGLAFGIDICSHREALAQGLPTVGVLAHGLDRIYPHQHKGTAKKMLEQGGLLTEFTSRTNPDRENFPKRNRIVAGLCDVLVVVETAIRGGAMITAEIANNYNKDIMALPGRVNDLYSEGCNSLIKKNKASIITCTQDLYELMNWDVARAASEPHQQLQIELNDEETLIVDYVRQRGKVSIDDLAFDLQKDSGTLSLTLLGMEFQGVLRQLPGKFYELI